MRAMRTLFLLGLSCFPRFSSALASPSPPTASSSNGGHPANANAHPHSEKTVVPFEKDAPIPITVLSGFLGVGKTQLLQHLLINNEGLRIAVVINDVASVNIDSKLVSSMNAAAGMIELQNGCACCSKSEELLASVADLVTLSDLRGEHDGFHHIVVEMSGVADPKSVRGKFQEAQLYDMPLLQRVRLDTMVTLVDCSTFLDYLKSAKTASPDDAPELFYRPGEEQEEPADDENIVPSGLVDILGPSANSPYSSSLEGDNNGVAELIVSQTETADVVLLNKVDLVNANKVSEIKEIVQALNPRARVMRTEFGDVPLRRVLGVGHGIGVVQAGVVDDHKDAIHAVICDDPDCNDPSHAHNHNHDSQKCQDPECTDTSHSHEHLHSHAHEHQHSHSQSHDHDHSSGHAGIGSFVYRARRPFHPGRLLSFLRHLPLKRGLPVETADLESPSISIPDAAEHVLGNVVRSKGFTWMGDSHVAAMYWSHAGSSFELSCLGSWWATLPKEQWPSEAVSTILQDFDNASHSEEDKDFSSVGDRRQEIVFIGPTLGNADNEAAIKQCLDQCLLNDSEWTTYVKNRNDDGALARVFQTDIEARIVSY